MSIVDKFRRYQSKNPQSGITQNDCDYFFKYASAGAFSSVYALSQLRPANLKLLGSSRLEPKSANACLRNEQFALAILNGGMATRFGGVPKGTVSIDGDMSFLGAKLLDAKKACEALGVPEPLCFLMCSSATLEPTAVHLRSHTASLVTPRIDSFYLASANLSDFYQMEKFISHQMAHHPSTEPAMETSPLAYESSLNSKSLVQLDGLSSYQMSTMFWQMYPYRYSMGSWTRMLRCLLSL